MPVTNRGDARAEIYALFQTAWLADALSDGVPVLYEGKKATVPTDAESGEPVDAPSWARVSLRHNTDQTGGTQASAGGDANGTRVYDREGVVSVQIFTTPGKGLRLADNLGSIAQKAFQGKTTSPGGIWFRHVRIVEVGASGDWYQTNVLAEFVYQEVT